MNVEKPRKSPVQHMKVFAVTDHLKVPHTTVCQVVKVS